MTSARQTGGAAKLKATERPNRTNHLIVVILRPGEFCPKRGEVPGKPSAAER
jgi:hypothetical protein